MLKKIIEKIGVNNSSLKEFFITWDILKGNLVSLIGMVILLCFIFFVIFGPLVAPYNPNAINLKDKFIAPNIKHIFGTDNLGRDVLSRVIYGARISFLAGIMVTGTAVTIGGLIGVIAGYSRKRYLGNILMRITDVFLAFPTLILAIALASILGPSLWNALMAMSLVYWPRYARIMYGQALSIRENEYVRFGEVLRESSLKIIRRHILPNAITPIIIQSSLDFGDVILLVAVLGFLGLGAQPPTPDWGAMISNGRDYLMSASWLTTIPGLAIFIVVLGFNFIGDGIRDALDPNLRHLKLFA